MNTSATTLKAAVKKRREVRIDGELWYTANWLLAAGKKEPKGSTHHFRSSLVFRAFAFEAFLNLLGHHLMPHWEYLERLRTWDKLALLIDLTHVKKPNYGSRPWQTVKMLFEFRNTIAHGKPGKPLEKDTFEDVDGFLDAKLGEQIQTEWERFGTEQNAVKAKEDVEKIANLLYKASRLAKKKPGTVGPFASGFHSHSATITQP